MKIRNSCLNVPMVTLVPEPGRRGWVIDSLSSPLPSGLPHRAGITVVEVGLAGDQKTPKIVVEDENGRQWAVTRHQLDMGHVMYLDGEFCYETHPKAVLFLRHVLRDLEERMRAETNDLHGSATWWLSDRERARWYLERNGFDPDEPIAPGATPLQTGWQA